MIKSIRNLFWFILYVLRMTIVQIIIGELETYVRQRIMVRKANYYNRPKSIFGDNGELRIQSTTETFADAVNREREKISRDIRAASAEERMRARRERNQGR